MKTTMNTLQINQTLTIPYPIVGYHTLKLLEGLRQSYRDAEKEIEKVQKLNRIWDYQKNKKISELRKYKSQIEAEFNFWSELVKDWISKFPDKYALYGIIVLEYYCDIKNVVSLQGIIDEILCEDEDRNKSPQNFQAKIRQICLNQIKNQ